MPRYDGFTPLSGEPLLIAIYAFDDVTMFHLAVPQMVFDEVRRLGLGEWRTVLFADSPGSIRTAEGLSVAGVLGPEAAENADLIVVPSWHSDQRVATVALLDVLGRAHARGAPIAGLCLGATPLVDAGLLDGRRAVTHWNAFDALRARHPGIDLDDAVLYVDHGDVLTSAGTASGLDACLHLVRTRLGADAANRVARSLVVAPHRDGGQAQYIDRPVAVSPEGDRLSEALSWARTHLDQPLTIDALAARAHLSRRTFIRAFRSTMGTTPASWVRELRLDEARRLLETTALPVEQVASACGFGSTVTFRQAFVNAYSVTPTHYRATFTTS